MTSLRIFLSYGHDEHVSLAIHLRDDLRTRKHTVWFDEERLQPGHDWESFIEQGLEHLAADKANAAVILLLTPHSVRRPDGYCLNEVARALGRGLRIIPLMVVESEPPLSICRIQWLDMRQCLPIHEKEAFYRPRFERLLKALEENQLDFEGTQNRLILALNPIQFSADIIKHLKDFTGRKWVFDEVDAWLADPSGSKIFWITGAPGVGKSAIAARIRDHRREIAAFHFCDINSEEKRNPAKVVCSIVYQLSTQLPEYEDRLARRPLESLVKESLEAYTLFDYLIVQPLAENFPVPDRTVVVLIDALDEATYQRQNELVRLLALCADKTPPWLRFLVTSRPDPEIISAFQQLSPYVLDTSRTENIQDLGDYLTLRLPGITRGQTETILERSEGVFLYVRHVVDSVLSNQLSLQRLEEFPRGLGAVYQQFFHRQFGGDMAYYEEQITTLLQPVMAAFEPLTLRLLKIFCRIVTDTELGRRLNRLGSLFPASGEGNEATVQPFHRSLCDWITNRDAAGHYLIAVADGHRILAEQGWRQYEHGPELMDDYFIQWLPAHLFEFKDNGQFHLLVVDDRYLREAARRGSLGRLISMLSAWGHFAYAEAPARLDYSIHLAGDGADSELTVASGRVLAEVLSRLAHYDEAEKLLRLFFSASKRINGEDHPQSLATADQLAGLLAAIDRIGEAIILREHAVAVAERTMLSGDLRSLTLSLNLADSLAKGNRLEEAAQLYAEKLSRLEILDDTESLSMNGLNGMAWVCHALGRYEQALRLFARAIKIAEITFSPDHRITLTYRNNRARLLLSVNDYTQETEEECDSVLEMRRRLFADSHPEVLGSLAVCGLLREKLGRFEEAWEFYRKAWEGFRACYSDEHPDTLCCLGDLARTEEACGRMEAAEEHFLTGRKTALESMGEYSPEYLRFTHDLAVHYFFRGEAFYPLALRLFEIASAGRRESAGIGPNHPETLASIEEAQQLRDRGIQPGDDPRITRILPVGTGRESEDCNEIIT